MGHEFRIDLEDDTPPVHRPLYKLSPLELEEAHKQIQYMLDSDSVPWGCHWGAGWLGYSVGTSEPFGRGLDTVALGGPPVFTSELIGEDSLAGH